MKSLDRPRPEVLVIGGGATGTGIARDLAMRGADVLLAEAGDLSTGASGGNHGMLHSGARYAATDPEAARECATEGEVLKRIASFCIEDTGGMFVSLPGDDNAYPDRFRNACCLSGVRAEEMGVNEALCSEPNLSREICAAFRVPDASVDPFFLVWGMAESARDAGATVLTHAPVTSLQVEDGRIIRAMLGRGGGRTTVRPEVVVNASGAWCGTIAAMAGQRIDMQLDKGSMVVFNGRVVNGLVNRLRPPADGDILVPHRSSTILGTTCGPGNLEDVRATVTEVEALLRTASEVLPGLSTARTIRAYAGVRPLLSGNGCGRQTSRGFSVIDHLDGGVENLLSVAGGKLTTCRLMAEKASDAVMGRLGRSGACRTMVEEIAPPASGGRGFQEAIMRRKYSAHADGIMAECITSPLGQEEACSCESVSVGELDHFAASPDVRTLSDLMRRTRAGMGYCQAGLCVFRMATALDVGEPRAEIERYLAERWKGISPVLRGEQLRQEAFKAHLFKVHGMDHTREG
jgi:glycerol-3-phosphate dehydrogenase